MKHLRHISLFIAVIIATALRAAVYTPASLPNPKDEDRQHYVANPDGILPDSDVVFLNQCADRLQRQTQVELCVVALASIGEADPFDFAYELFQRWGIGGKGKNTGVLILFAEESHDVRIMTGVGIEGVLPDATCSKIIHDEMIPAFRQGDYGGGLCLGALRIYSICTNGDVPEELLNAKSVTNRGKYAEDEAWSAEDWIILVALIVFIAILIWASSKGNRNGRSGGYSSGGGSVIFSSGGSSFGGGGSFGGSWGGGSTLGGGAGGKW